MTYDMPFQRIRELCCVLLIEIDFVSLTAIFKQFTQDWCYRGVTTGTNDSKVLEESIVCLLSSSNKYRRHTKSL